MHSFSEVPGNQQFDSSTLTDRSSVPIKLYVALGGRDTQCNLQLKPLRPLSAIFTRDQK